MKNKEWGEDEWWKMEKGWEGKDMRWRKETVERKMREDEEKEDVKT